MAVYVIGDLQGCYRHFKKLLKDINFRSDKDVIWFVGDIVNRGPDSLKTLRYVKQMSEQGQAIVVLGNHDLHLLAAFHGTAKLRGGDNLKPVIKASDSEDLLEWLRYRPLMHFDPDLNFAMVHAGIYPGWTISQALQRAREVEQELTGDQFLVFFKNMYGNHPDRWSDDLQGLPRLRFITNVFTRMRYLRFDMSLDMNLKGAPNKEKDLTVMPWFEFKPMANKFNRVAFGHWSTLPVHQYGHFYALDSGCVWGGRLTALRIDKKTPRWISRSCADEVL